MKKILKIILRVSSLLALVVFAFFVSIINRFGGKTEDLNKDRPSPQDGLFSAFTVHTALADAPSDGSAGSDCFGSGDSSDDGCGDDGGGDGGGCGE